MLVALIIMFRNLLLNFGSLITTFPPPHTLELNTLTLLSDFTLLILEILEDGFWLQVFNEKVNPFIYSCAPCHITGAMTHILETKQS